MATVIEVNDLVKQFKDTRAVDHLSFTVNQGEIFGFLGQNGAGKSTTIRMLVSLINPDEGDIQIFGKSLRTSRREILRKVGAIIERPDLYKYLTAYENLKIFAAMSGVRPGRKQLMDQLEMVGLAERAAHKVHTYSQGMKQRLGIATALIHDPELIILDEPTNGLDPQGIADMRNLILHLGRNMGKTVLVSSHLLSEIELVADSMIIIDNGRKLAAGRVNELFDPAQTLVELRSNNAADLKDRILRSPLHTYFKGERGETLLLRVHRDQLDEVLRAAGSLDAGIVSMNARHSLEDYFLQLTSGQQHVDAFKN